jgi:hypothetical protein
LTENEFTTGFIKLVGYDYLSSTCKNSYCPPWRQFEEIEDADIKRGFEKCVNKEKMYSVLTDLNCQTPEGVRAAVIGTTTPTR